MANYHCLEEPQGDWRKEQPEVDRNIEDLIERLAEGTVTIPAYREEMGKYMTAVMVLNKSGKLSAYARGQYERIVAVVEQHFENGND